MRVLLPLILVFTNSVYAFNFGTGMAPGMQCPSDFGPAGPSFHGNDEISNLAGQLSTAERRLLIKEQKLDALKEDIAAAKTKIRRVIRSSSAMADIERHYKYRAHPDDYSTACGRRERYTRGDTPASAGSQESNVVNRPSRNEVVQGNEDPGRYAVPSDFCQGGVNDWQHVVAEDGMVLDAICDYEIPLSRNRPDESRSQDCREGLDAYYDKMAKREALEQEVRELRDKVNAYTEDAERIQDQIAEGTYTPGCSRCERRGQSQLGMSNFASMGVALLGALFNRQQQPQPMLVRVPRQPPGILPFPGPAAFPGRPYPAPIPGYHGMHPGFGPGRAIYGAAPGSIGPGGFACQGTSPFSFGNPLAPQFMPFQNSNSNPWLNPHADPFGQGPFAQHPLLNPGFGPGILPYLGNGVNGYNPFDPYADPFGNNPFNQFGPNAPGVLPYMGNQQNPWGQNQWGQNPWGQNQWGRNPPGVLPYNGANPWGQNQWGQNQWGNQWGGNRFGLGGPPGVLPYIGSPLNNVPYAGSPWGSQFSPTPVQNYGYQMYQLRQSINQIGGGQYGPPAVLPYISNPGIPVTNTPYPGAPPPPPRQPTSPGNAPAVRPAQIR